MAMSKRSAGFLGIVKKVNSFLAPDSTMRTCLPFIVGGRVVGMVRPDALRELEKHSEVFKVHRGDAVEPRKRTGVYLSEALTTKEERTKAVSEVLQSLRQEGNLCSLKGWRNEDYGIHASFVEPCVFAMERSGVALIGAVQYGTHVNGYTYDEVTGEMKMWIARRAKTKATWPDMLDNMCAGGLTAGCSVEEVTRRECQEEASVEEKLLDRLKPTGCISFVYEDKRGVFPETQFTYDLELPSTFNPVNADNEVADFRLLPIQEVADLITTDEFKPDSALVVLDFLIRHGIVNHANEPNYCSLIELMHVGVQDLEGLMKRTLSTHNSLQPLMDELADAKELNLPVP